MEKNQIFIALLFVSLIYITYSFVHLNGSSLLVSPSKKIYNQKNLKIDVENSNLEIVKTKCNYGENWPRILCAIFTFKDVHKTTLIPVHETWAKR